MPNSIQFRESIPLTLGVELELQLIDPETYDLIPAALPILKAIGSAQVKAELFQSMLEVNTPICANAFEVQSTLLSTLKSVLSEADQLGVLVCSAGTHPYADYRERLLYPDERYTKLFERKQWIARRLQIFGLHVHVGMRNGDHAIQMNNALLHYLPLLLSISASSPFCEGEDTMLASSRTTFFESSPVAGHPCLVNDWDDFCEVVTSMRNAGAIGSLKDVWWDIRPSPDFGTIEIRICDSPPTLSEICSLTALIHSLCIYIDKQILSGRRFAPPPLWILRENKWRAARYGREASLIVNAAGESLAADQMLRSLIEELKLIITEQSYDYLLQPYKNLEKREAPYERQRRIYATSHGDLTSVVKDLVREFERDILKMRLFPGRRVI